ncbi:tripartite tricarboxylate transporter TctB family protein [Chloroflexota bacterium]
MLFSKRRKVRHYLARQSKPKTTAELKERKENGIELRRLFLIFGWVIAFMLGIYLLGFIIAIPLFTFSYLKWRRRSWISAIVFSGAMLASIYGIFSLGLKVPLFEGVIFGG